MGGRGFGARGKPLRLGQAILSRRGCATTVPAVSESDSGAQVPSTRPSPFVPVDQHLFAVSRATEAVSTLV